ncbi:MAG: HK97 gp10 family phage protein [Alphaproteobacteria bacterium]|nr:HK97 gp10 family phage protein [Alphaproteobacteria bacterium]
MERLRALPEAVNSRLLRLITQLGIELQLAVQQEKLSGQVLRSRSGSLKSSIGVKVDQSGGTITASVFSESQYAGAQEYGFAGTVSVRASLRRMTEAFGRPIAEKMISVRAYDRRMDLPERSFLRSALDDMTPAIREEVEAALAQGVSQ